MIETLDNTNRSEAVDLIGEAFRAHPFLPPDPSGSKAKLLAKAILDGFAAAPDAQLFGIRGEDARLDCAAFVYNATHEPRGLTLALFLVRMIRIAGWRMSRTFAQVLSEEPEGKEQRLELMLLGTRSSSQKLGLGRVMIRHIFGFAKSRGYQSVVLGVAKETPAFGFYQREGFVVEKEIALPIMPLCLLRRPLSEQETRDQSAADIEKPPKHVQDIVE